MPSHVSPLRTMALAARTNVVCKARGETVNGNPYWYKRLNTAESGAPTWVAAGHAKVIHGRPRLCLTSFPDRILVQERLPKIPPVLGHDPAVLQYDRPHVTK